MLRYYNRQMESYVITLQSSGRRHRLTKPVAAGDGLVTNRVVRSIIAETADRAADFRGRGLLARWPSFKLCPDVPR
jgi:hypothetical protein